MDKKKVLGFRRFVSKKGTPCLVMNVSFPYADRQIENGACGETVEDLFIPKEYHDKVTPAIIGKYVIFTYDISGGRAFLTGFEVCK